MAYTPIKMQVACSGEVSHVFYHVSLVLPSHNADNSRLFLITISWHIKGDRKVWSKGHLICIITSYPSLILARVLFILLHNQTDIAIRIVDGHYKVNSMTAPLLPWAHENNHHRCWLPSRTQNSWSDVLIFYSHMAAFLCVAWASTSSVILSLYGRSDIFRGFFLPFCIHQPSLRTTQWDIEKC